MPLVIRAFIMAKIEEVCCQDFVCQEELPYRSMQIKKGSHKSKEKSRKRILWELQKNSPGNILTLINACNNILMLVNMLSEDCLNDK